MTDTTPPEIQLPTIEEITSEALNRWETLPDNKPILVPFTKQELMFFIAGLRQSTLATLYLGDALQSLSRQDTAKADEAFNLYQMSARQSYTSASRFINTMMSKAVTDVGSENV